MQHLQKKILVSVISDLTTDQRVIRICTTLREMGFDVHVIARQFNNSLPLDNYNFTAERIMCYFRKGVWQYAEFNIKLFFKLLSKKKDILLANDLDVLAPNFLLSRLQHKELVYDTHEYFTGVPELKKSPFKRRIWKTLEDFIFPKLKTVYTVNESVRKKYFDEYQKPIGIVRNIPMNFTYNPLPLPADWEGKKILLMQGAGINEGRGGIELLETMKYLPEDYLLVFIGSGTHWDYIKNMRSEWHLERKVVMLDKMSPSLLKRHTPLAHIGFTLDKKDDLNYLFNLPNKIFDYIHAGVPVVAIDIPEVKLIIDQYKCGEYIDSADPRMLAATIQKMMSDEHRYLSYKTNCSIAAKELNWDMEKQKLIDIYKPYL